MKKKKNKYTMKGYRSSPYNATDYDNLTEDEKIALVDRASEDKKEKEQKEKRLRMHNPKEDNKRGSAY